MNTTTENNSGTPGGEISIDQKAEILRGELSRLSSVLDTMYLEMATIIEILADKEIITPESWSAKIKEVAEDMQARLKEAIDARNKAEGEDTVKDSDGTIETPGAGDIVMPDSGIIIP